MKKLSDVEENPFMSSFENLSGSLLEKGVEGSNKSTLDPSSNGRSISLMKYVAQLKDEH